MKKQALVAALVAGAFAGCVGVKQIGYIGASSGVKPNALKIVEVAEANDVVTIENRPLARRLYAETELDQMIPPDLYEAVADVMVYLYKMDRMQAPADVAREIAEAD